MAGSVKDDAKAPRHHNLSLDITGRDLKRIGTCSSILSEKEVEEGDEHNKGYHGERTKGDITDKQTAQLVDNQRQAVCIDQHVGYREGKPLT